MINLAQRLASAQALRLIGTFASFASLAVEVAGLAPFGNHRLCAARYESGKGVAS